MARVVLSVVLVVMLVGAASAKTAGTGATPIGNKSSDISPIGTLEAAVAAIDRHDWSTYPNLWVSQQASDLRAFLSTLENAERKVGLFAIQSAKLAEFKRLPPEIAAAITNIDRYETAYGRAVAFYAGIDYRVDRETQFYYNGVNYEIVVVVPENGQWRIAEWSQAPVEILADTPSAFRSAAESKALTVAQAKHRGKATNPAGDILEDLAATPQQLQEERGMTNPNSSVVITPQGHSSGEHVRPNTISVYMTYDTNKQHYGCSSNCTWTVDFYHYTKNVLPNEWVASADPFEALKAGAMAVKMYGWYHVYHPKWPQFYAHVKDNTEDQKYIWNSEYPRSTDAINAMAGIGLETANTHKIFEAQYIQGTKDASGKNSGKVSQLGTVYWGEKGKNYDFMLHYYFDNSPNTNYEPMGYFRC